MALAKPKLELVSPERRVEAFSLDIAWLQRSQGIRLDASHYNPRMAKALELLRATGMELRRLDQVTERIFIPPRFKRIYVEPEYGVPFLQGSHIVHFEPADLKYLSKTAHKNLDRWIVRGGWILVTCSGTIGRVTIAPPSWDSWAASQHILRIIPAQNSPCLPGYIYAFLRSFPGQAQLTSHIYGAVVDELTEDQASSVLIPVPSSQEQHKRVAQIHDLALQSVARKEEAVLLAERSLHTVSDFLTNEGSIG